MFDRAFKVVLLGDRGVGKTTLLHKISSDTIEPQYIPTLKANIAERNFTFSKYVFKLLVWDIEQTPNKEGIVRIFADPDAIVTLFDICNPQTLNTAEKQYNLIRCIRKPTRWLVGNKIDLTDCRAVHDTEATKLAEKLSSNYAEISAKTGENVEKLIMSVLKELLTARLEELEVTLRV